MGGILRITPDGKRGFISQRTFDNGINGQSLEVTKTLRW
jgi:hypothetical protein